MTKNIYIYNDEGVGDFSLFAAQRYFKGNDLTLISAAQIIENGIPDSVDLMVIPGGADLPYAKKLNGKGNQNIRRYVENGGTYLGICAGAYYGCAKIEFQKNTPHAICEDRELSFFKGTAIGCLQDIAPAYDKTLNTAAVTTITTGENTHNVLYWGGCYFTPQGVENFEIIARYEAVSGHPPAIISCAVGKGKAVLSGVHFEVMKETFEDYDFEQDDENKLKINLKNNLPDKKFNLEDIV